MLGRINQLHLPVLQMVMNHLKKTSSMLRRTQEGKQDLDHVLYENTFYLCSIFEDVICNHGDVIGYHGDEIGNHSDEQQQETQTGFVKRFKSKLSSDAIFSLHEGLENCLLHISRDYPLYAQFIWRLTGALECLELI